MEYWTRTGSLADIAIFVILCLLWAVGGVLISNRAFRLKLREKLVSGLALGFLLFVVFSNLLAQMLSLPLAYWMASGTIFLIGLVMAILSKNGLRVNLEPLKHLPQLIALCVVFVVFTFILRGLAIFDDYYHLPLISVMATGDIPPHFYLDPSLNLPYHYGLQVFAAGMVRLGGFFVWSAWDISRAFVYACSVLLAWLWIRRLTRSELPAYLGTILLIFGGATRWLLLLIPPTLLNSMGANLHMDISGITAGGNLVTALTNIWPMDGGGPLPFPFAFASGIFEPLNMQLGATGAMWEMTILLLLLLWSSRQTSLLSSLIIGLVLASLALSAEHVFILLVAGIAILLLISLIRNRIKHRSNNLERLKTWGIPVVISALLALFQGGFITGGFFSLLSSLTGHSYPMVTTDFQGFSLRWPPAMPSGHFGPLSLFDPGQIVIMLAEAGPALLLLPLVIVYWLRPGRETRCLPQALAAGAIISLLFPIFFRYGLDFDITRLVGASLWLSYGLAFPVLWLWLVRAKNGFRLAAGIGYGIAILAGLVTLSVELVAIPVPQTTYYIKYNEGDFSRIYWNQFAQDAQVLDSMPERAVLLFGRASFAATDVYKRSDSWKALVAQPDPYNALSAGYSYVYMNDSWWQAIPPDIQAAYNQPCVQLVDQMDMPDDHFRKLYNIQACHP
jgi:hypothetical protein